MVGALVLLATIASPSPADVQRSVDAAIASGATGYILPPSTAPYNFGNKPLLIQSAHTFHLLLGDNALLFSVSAGVLIRDSTKVVLEGGTISYSPVTVAQGILVSAEQEDEGGTTTSKGRVDDGGSMPSANRGSPTTRGKVQLDAGYADQLAMYVCNRCSLSTYNLFLTLEALEGHHPLQQ
jgi:hypothetical protein